MSEIAEEGKIWVCLACGKTSKDRYGDAGTGWDESCFLHSELLDEGKLRFKEGRVVEILE